MASVRESITEAIKYLEPRRLIYNAVLTVIVLYYFWRGLPFSGDILGLNFFLFVFLLAVLANVVYCAAYLVDVFAQLSGVRPEWLRYRWILLLTGICFASVITRFVSMAMFLVI